MIANLLDNTQSWKLCADGEYLRDNSQTNLFNAHNYFMLNPSLSGRGSALKSTETPDLRLVKP